MEKETPVSATDASDAAPVVSAAQAPSGTEALAAEWVQVALSGGHTVLATVARPTAAHSRPFFSCMAATASPKSTCV